MTILNTNRQYKHFGKSWMDFLCDIEREILTDNGEHLFIQVEYAPDGAKAYMVGDKSIMGDYMPDYEPFEMYHTLAKCKKSDFYNEFVDLDKEMKGYQREALLSVDDTFNYRNGMRMGAKLSSKGFSYYTEAVLVDENNIARAYIQIVKNNGVTTYSETNRSIFMRLELGDMYSAYFKEKKVKYYYKNPNILEAEHNLQTLFAELEKELDDYIDFLKKKGNH